MKNILEYYYNIKIDEYEEKDNYYVINNNYIVVKLEEINRINNIYKLVNNIEGINKIILNRENSPITKINEDYYVMIRNYYLIKPSLRNISNMSRIDISYVSGLERNNWEVLWGEKIDYFERWVMENMKKFPLIRESFDYFIGLGENAISYLVNTKIEERKENSDNKVISHNNLYTSLSNPLNVIIDHKARDVSEYIKFSFFNNNYNIFNELEEYFRYNYYSVYGIRVLYARVIYPSFYFDLYEKIIRDEKEEKELNKIISKIEEYENYLNNIYLYLSRYYNIPRVEWIRKK